MTVPSWPATLPRPTRAGYQAGRQDPRLRKPAEIGPPGYRRRWSSVARPVSLAIIVPRSLKATFDLFHDTTTAHGTLPFWMPDPVTDGWTMLGADGAPVLEADGTPVLLAAQWLCLFGEEPPVETLKGLEFNIAFSVVVLP